MEYMTFSEKKDKSYKAYSMELAGRTLTIDIGRVAAQANGAALMHYGVPIFRMVIHIATVDRLSNLDHLTCCKYRYQ